MTPLKENQVLCRVLSAVRAVQGLNRGVTPAAETVTLELIKHDAASGGMNLMPYKGNMIKIQQRGG